jgi:hypothetical protein
VTFLPGHRNNVGKAQRKQILHAFIRHALIDSPAVDN